MNRSQTPYSQLKIFHHPDIINNLMAGKRCAPLYIRIKPENKCNQNCSYCHYKNSYLNLDEYNPNEEMPHDKMMELIEDMKQMGVKAVTFSGGGEPLLYPYIEESMQRILDYGIDLSIITNGSLLSGKKAELLSKAKWVRISVESANDDEYCSIRGIKAGSFLKLCENINEFSKNKDNCCELGINVVVNERNHDEIYEIAKLMKSLGVNHVKFSPMITNETKKYHETFVEQVTKELRRTEQELSDSDFKIINLYTSDFEDSVFFERQYSRCPIKEFVCVIGANQKVYFCHDKAYLSDGVVCDIRNRSFREAWFSDEVNCLFEQFDAKNVCRQHCVYDSRNNLINTFLDMNKNHLNFV